MPVRKREIAGVPQLFFRIRGVFCEGAVLAQLLDLLLVCCEGLGRAASFAKKEFAGSLSDPGLRGYPGPSR